MEVIGCKLRQTHIPFKVDFSHATKTRSAVDGILLEVVTDTGTIGYGEALPREYVTGETNQSVLSAMENTVIPGLLGRQFDNFESLAQWFGSFQQHYPALKANELCVKTLTELALLDVFGKTRQQSLIGLLGGAHRDTLEYTGTVTAGKAEGIETYLQAYEDIGLRQFKLKVGFSWQQDREIVQWVRNRFGADAEIRVDANEAWDLPTAKTRLAALADLGVVCCEQPMPAACRDDYPELRQFIDKRLNICVDESLCSMEDAQWLAKNQGTDVFNLRVSKNGGILTTLELAKIARQAGVVCQLGAQVGETSILTRAGQIVAEHLGDLIYHEGAFGTMLLDYDITDTPLMFSRQGLFDCRPLRDKPGLGVAVSDVLIEKMTRQQAVFT